MNHLNQGTSSKSYVKRNRLWRWTLGCVAISALAACDESSIVQNADAAAATSGASTNVATGTIGSVTTAATGTSTTAAGTTTAGAVSTASTSATAAGTTTAGAVSTGTGAPASTTAAVKPVITQAAAAVAPTVSLTASPTTVASGGTSTMTWSSTRATACKASASDAAGALSESVPLSGTWTTPKLTSSAEFQLTCEGSGGTATQSITVTVAGSAPAVALSASPSTINSRGASTLTWTSSNATACTASGAWSGTKALQGSFPTGALSNNASYALTCTGPHGTATQTATVTVKSIEPTVTLTASPSTLASGASSTLHWSAVNALSCNAGGAWSGTKALTGTQSTGALTANSTYTLTCAGPGGSAAQSATVTIASTAPTVTLSVGPNSIASGDSATLNWTANNATACTASGAWTGAKAVHGSQSTGDLTATSTYTLTCAGAGGTAKQSATVSVKAPTPTISLVANPSSVLSNGATTLTWSAANATACKASGAWSGNKALAGTQSSGALTANSVFGLACTGPGGSAAQSVTVTVSPHTTAVVSLSAKPSTVSRGSETTLAWSATNATACTASGGWSGSKPVSGSQSTGALTANTTYALACTGPGGGATQTTTVSVTSPGPGVSLTLNPTTVKSGASTALTWSSTNATACTASGGWSGAKPVSGSQSSGALTASKTYTLTCTGPGGSATQSATVTVSSSAPTVTLKASPSTVPSGSAASLSWSSTNATACAASGSWSGALATSGTRATGALTASQSYDITCTGAGGSAMQSATVTVSSPAPTVTFTASPSSVRSGAASTLTWSATHATACTAQGSWSGSKAVSGTQSTGALTANQSYGLTCTGPGGSASQTAAVSVTAAAPTVTLSANPSTVKSGNTTTLSWTSTNATSCSASGGWSGAKATSGSSATAALTANTTYSITCTGSGGSAVQSATVTVSAVLPTVSLSAQPTNVANGGSSNLTWTSSNATSCAATGGGWSGSPATSGSYATGALKATTTFTLSCTGAGGTAKQSVTVTVAAATTGSATLSWSPPTTDTNGGPVTTLTGYHIYYGTSPSVMNQSVAVSGAATTTYTVTGLTTGTWYFSVAADASDGTESAQSPVGSKTL